MEKSMSREPIDFPTGHCLTPALEKFQEQLLCPCCQELFDNPEVLLCGHSFCSLCIRRHCDPAINRSGSTANICPICRAKVDTFDLRKNVTLAVAVEQFRELRSPLAAALSNAAVSIPSIISNENTNNSVNGKTITSRLSQFNLHGLSKDKVKKIIEQATVGSRVKLRMDGDKDALDKRLKDFIHLHNAQIGAVTPLTLDQVVQKINTQSLAMEKEQAKAAATLSSVEKLKNGQETTEISLNFKKLAQIAKKNKKKLLQSLESKVDAPQDILTESDTKVEEINQTLIPNITSVDSENPPTMDDWTWLDRIPSAIKNEWQIIFSQKFQRPFFYHVATNTGQFRIPLAFESFHYSSSAATMPTTLVVNTINETQSITAAIEPIANAKKPHGSKRKHVESIASSDGIVTSNSRASNAMDSELTNFSQRTRRSTRGNKNQVQSDSLLASQQTQSPSQAIMINLNDIHRQPKLEEEERLILTAESQDMFSPTNIIYSQPLLPSHSNTIIVVGGNSDTSAENDSAVETIDMTEFDLHKMNQEVPTLGKGKLCPTSAEKTQIDVELLAAVGDILPSESIINTTQNQQNQQSSYLRAGNDRDDDDDKSAISLSSTWTPSQSQAQANAMANSGPWSCALCTYLNPIPSAKCAVCDHSNPLYLNLASRPKRSASSTPTHTGGASSFTYNQDALRRIQSSSQQNKKRKLQQSSITSSISK